MQKAKGFSLIELMVSVAIVAILGTLAIGPMTGLFAIVRDGIRRYHIGTYAKSLQTIAMSGYLPTPTSYGKDDGNGWDYSYVNPNGGGKFFLHFLNGTYDTAIDPINDGVGNITCPACGGTGFGYFYYCYKIQNCTGPDAASATWWGHTGCGDYAMIGARLERDSTTIYYRRIDNITCL